MAESLRRDYTTDRMTLTFRLKDDEGNERSRSSAKNTSGVRQPRPLRRMICAALIFGIISSECFVPMTPEEMSRTTMSIECGHTVGDSLTK
jgi:hypothetical protein